MSRVGNCYDNACVESFFGHFKEEFYLFHSPKNFEELKQNLEEFMKYYNNERIQLRLKTSPIKFKNISNPMTSLSVST